METDSAGMEQLKREFRKKLFGRAMGYALRKMLPAPLGMFFSLMRYRPYFGKGVRSLLHGRVNVAVLDSVSIGAAFASGAVSTANSIMFLLSITELLEEHTRRKTRRALSESLAVNVERAWKVEDGKETSVPFASLVCGDVIRIRDGSMIPADGVVVFGECEVNEASMTGESTLVHKAKASTVYAGTAVEQGSIQVLITALRHETRISRIMDMIDRSEGMKALMQSRAESLADAIVPYTLLSSVCFYFLTRNVTRAISLLMVDYSCAIKLAVPISVISAMREASQRRVAVKGGRSLEAFAEADTIVFDKTGTLTSASPSVAKVVPLAGYTRDEVLRISACLEEHFPHSVARAVVRQAECEGLVHDEQHAEVAYVVAHGIASSLHGQRTLIGSHHFIFEDEGVELTPEIQTAIDREGARSSNIYLAIDGRLAGFLCIEDPLRPEAAGVIRKLRAQGISRIIMLTGDGENAARNVAEELGIDEYRAQVLPGDKARIVQEFKDRGHCVIMVGDGINDSPALSCADVSVAMNDASDLAREVADITLLSSDLRELIALRRLSRALLDRIQSNYRFIVGFNSSLIALGMAGMLSPAAIAFWHNASTMAVSARSARPCLA